MQQYDPMRFSYHLKWNHAFFKSFLTFFRRWGGSYITYILEPLCKKKGWDTDTPSWASTKFLLFDPWSHTITRTDNPIVDSLSMASFTKMWSLSPDTGPELKKYPIHCFHLRFIPRMINYSAWFAIIFFPWCHSLRILQYCQGRDRKLIQILLSFHQSQNTLFISLYHGRYLLFEGSKNVIIKSSIYLRFLDCI